jgi:twitching motility protein PilU
MREVGITPLKNRLRQAPDLIYIGEIRDRATMEYAMSLTETGHLCVSTIHANQALERIINFFPEERHAQLLMDRSLNLIGVLSQRLIVSSAGERCAAIEVLLVSPLVKDLILQGDIQSLKEVMEKSVDQGMKTFDQVLLGLFHDGEITEEEALCNADSANNLRLKIKLADDGRVGGGRSGLSLESPD